MRLLALLAGEAETLRLGAALAKVLESPRAGSGVCPALLLAGDLGAGKTTLMRGLVAALEGGDLAEVASPSFNLQNLYPTRPPVAHFDLYRLSAAQPDEELLEELADRERIAAVEWIERLAPELWPEPWLHVLLTPRGRGRGALLTCRGEAAAAALTRLKPHLDAAGLLDHTATPL